MATASVPAAPRHARRTPTWRSVLSSFDTAAPSAGARPVKPASCWCDHETPPVQPRPPVRNDNAPLRASRPPEPAADAATPRRVEMSYIGG